MNGQDEEAGTAIRVTADRIRYAQCWEDAAVMLNGLGCRPSDHCLSIASAGDNALALLTRDPDRVICIDLSPAQLACVELRMAAYRSLDHDAFLELYGARASRRRTELLEACLSGLPPGTRRFWCERRASVIRHGFAGVGRFESYFRLFRRMILPLTQNRRNIRRLLFEHQSREQRRVFHDTVWNNCRWRMLFGIFSSRSVLAALGRDAAFFAHAEGSLSAHICRRIAHTVVTLDPISNPYLHWIMTGQFGDALPIALQANQFQVIRDRLERIELRCGSLQEEAQRLHKRGERFHRFNLSDVFEYMTRAAANELLSDLAGIGVSGGRLLYWNMMVPRSRPAALAGRLRPLGGLAKRLHQADRAFFYRRLVIEEIR